MNKNIYRYCYICVSMYICLYMYIYTFILIHTLICRGTVHAKKSRSSVIVVYFKIFFKVVELIM